MADYPRCACGAIAPLWVLHLQRDMCPDCFRKLPVCSGQTPNGCIVNSALGRQMLFGQSVVARASVAAKQ